MQLYKSSLKKFISPFFSKLLSRATVRCQLWHWPRFRF